jgi:hypothetical protein
MAKTCVAPFCDRAGTFCRGFCSSCYLAFRKACRENGSWTDKDDREEAMTKLLHPVQHFEYEGDEGALIKALEAQEKRDSESDLKKENGNG